MEKKTKSWSPRWEGPLEVVQVFSNGAYEIEELAPIRRIFRINEKYLKRCKHVLQEVKIGAKIATFEKIGGQKCN
ncbi:hypothetical protein MTR_6g033990 [Medicago truncatula]|uniref:Uncharacterized protein n=1 Tax=Medicago truncatula TaxID=3880 RepID=A0A072UIW6_MEDTR|nr:hypothetical protein MTR_6g033990 [Medicago truncatula]